MSDTTVEYSADDAKKAYNTLKGQLECLAITKCLGSNTGIEFNEKENEGAILGSTITMKQYKGTPFDIKLELTRPYFIFNHNNYIVLVMVVRKDFDFGKYRDYCHVYDYSRSFNNLAVMHIADPLAINTNTIQEWLDDLSKREVDPKLIPCGFIMANGINQTYNCSIEGIEARMKADKLSPIVLPRLDLHQQLESLSYRTPNHEETTPHEGNIIKYGHGFNA